MQAGLQMLKVLWSFDTLSNIDFWGEDLTNINNLYEKVKAHFDNIKNLGIKKALEILVNE